MVSLVLRLTQELGDLLDSQEAYGTMGCSRTDGGGGAAPDPMDHPCRQVRSPELSQKLCQDCKIPSFNTRSHSQL